MELKLTFDYGESTELKSLSQAVSSFCQALEKYSRSPIPIEIQRIEGGSLVCYAVLHTEATPFIDLLYQDIQEARETGRSLFVPNDVAKKLGAALKNINSISIDQNGRTAIIDKPIADTFASAKQETNISRASCTGIISKVDLRSNSFLLVLPNGHRVDCNPVLPFIEQVRDTLEQRVPRLTVSGQGKFQRGTLLPDSVKVESAKIPRPVGLAEALSEVEQAPELRTLVAMIDRAANDSREEME